MKITRCFLEVDSVPVADFHSFTESARPVRKQVNLMHQTDYASLTQRYKFEVDYVIPAPPAVPVNFEAIGTGSNSVTVEIDNGGHSSQFIQYTDVAVLDLGDVTINGEGEAVRKITFHASQRNGNDGSEPSSLGSVI